MNLFHHVCDIQAPPETVFASITTAEGLSSWWTTEVTADTAECGSLFLTTFRGPFNPQLRITEIESPSLVAWEGVSGHDAWGTTPSVSNLTVLTPGQWCASGTRWERIDPTTQSLQRTSRGVLPRQLAPPVQDGSGQALSISSTA